MIIDELIRLFFELSINNDNIFFANSPFIVPQNACDPIFVLKLFEFGVKGISFELDKDTVPFLQTIEFAFPNFQLLSDRVESLLAADAEKITDVD